MTNYTGNLPRKLVMNVRNTRYDLVRDSAKEVLGAWLVDKDEDVCDWDLLWCDLGIPPEWLMKMKDYQWMNHYPGMYQLAWKNTLCWNLNLLRWECKEELDGEYDFYPQTWCLPLEWNEFKSQFNWKRNKTFIVKPEASCQGWGIFLTRNYESLNATDHCVVQWYIHKPMLSNGLKFDLWIYVMLYGVDPLWIYIYEEGLCRFATEPY